MKIICKSTGETVSEITTNHSMTLDEAIRHVGEILNTEDEIEAADGCNVIIDGNGYDWEDLEIWN